MTDDECEGLINMRPELHIQKASRHELEVFKAVQLDPDLIESIKIANTDGIQRARNEKIKQEIRFS